MNARLSRPKRSINQVQRRPVARAAGTQAQSQTDVRPELWRMHPALAQRSPRCLRLLLLRCSHQPLEKGSAYLRDTQPSMCIHARSAKPDRSLGQEPQVSPGFQSNNFAAIETLVERQERDRCLRPPMRAFGKGASFNGIARNVCVSGDGTS